MVAYEAPVSHRWVVHVGFVWWPMDPSWAGDRGLIGRPCGYPWVARESPMGSASVSHG